jgi:mRNA-degrading endonuclease RelE of RelBE toxin-antitoxin system
VEISYTPRFEKLFRKLPAKTRQLADRTFDRLERNPKHPGLHFKCVNPQKSRYSVRIGLKYRALGVLRGNEITLDCIGPHGKYDRLI